MERIEKASIIAQGSRNKKELKGIVRQLWSEKAEHYNPLNYCSGMLSNYSETLEQSKDLTVKLLQHARGHKYKIQISEFENKAKQASIPITPILGTEFEHVINKDQSLTNHGFESQLDSDEETPYKKFLSSSDIFAKQELSFGNQ